MSWVEDRFDVIVVGVLSLIVATILVVGARALSVERECLALGYPDFKITWAMEPYCVKRLEQTDVVVPLDKARAEFAQEDSGLAP